MADYIIRSFDKNFGTIVVEYKGYNINIDLPIVDQKYPEGDELDQYIDNFLPKEFVARKDIIAQGIQNQSTIEALVVPLPPPTQETVFQQPTTTGTVDA